MLVLFYRVVLNSAVVVSGARFVVGMLCDVWSDIIYERIMYVNGWNGIETNIYSRSYRGKYNIWLGSRVAYVISRSAHAHSW